ncbi:MAG: TlpA family protein disulfide reductase [Armatimonadetes bacterium]|nr:TlpA family protein disulfide reductase [Armatimonadota bacterium]
MLSLLALALVAHQDGQLSLDPKGAVTARLGYYPIRVDLAAAKPSNVTKEPAYRTTPKYGLIKVGNGPKATTVIAVDEPADQDWKIYIDKNQNGDLTDDGDGAWNKKADTRGRTMYGVMDVTVHASYGTATEETSASDYMLGFYRFVGQDFVLMYRQSARTGTVSIGGKSHKAVLVENDADGLFDKTAASAEEAGKSRPMWLKVDSTDDGKFATMIDTRAPFEYEGKAYEAKVKPDGSHISIAPTDKPVIDLTPKQAAAKPLLASGSMAPNFVAQKWGGGDLKLSDYRGKVVILDFWATWCGPCQESMPHVESVFKKVKSKGVAVIGVCVWDDKSAYEEWVPQNKSKYTFQFAFDPAGKDTAKSIASSMFNVNGIPTTYIIGKDGKVVDSVVGYEEGDKRVEAALAKAGVKVD